MLVRSAALLRQLPALQAACDGQAGAPGPQPLHQHQLQHIGLMSVQLIAYSCTTSDPDGLEGGPVIPKYGSLPRHLHAARCAFGLQHLPLLLQPLMTRLAASGLGFAACAAERARKVAGTIKQESEGGSGQISTSGSGSGGDEVPDGGCGSSSGQSAAAAPARLDGSAGKAAAPAAAPADGPSPAESTRAVQASQPPSSAACDMDMWIEWKFTVQHASTLLWSLGAQGVALDGLADAPPSGRGGMALHQSAVAAEAAAEAAGSWPLRDPATLAAAAAAALQLLGQYHSVREAVLPWASGLAHLPGPHINSRECSLLLRFAQRVPHACAQLLAAAGASLGVANARELEAALPPLLDAAGAACKLVQLACQDTAHWALLGAAAAAQAAAHATASPGQLSTCHAYRPLGLALAAAGAASTCMVRLLPYALPGLQAFVRRCAQLCFSPLTCACCLTGLVRGRSLVDALLPTLLQACAGSAVAALLCHRSGSKRAARAGERSRHRPCQRRQQPARRPGLFAAAEQCQ